MSWFTPTDITYHPCVLPNEGEHRRGEWWRCEVCDALWRLREAEPGEDGPFDLNPGTKFELMSSWFDRWRYRKEGYSSANQD